MSRGHIKPGIGPSLLGMIVGVLFVILGLTVFIPVGNAAGFPASIFAIIWTVAAGIVGNTKRLYSMKSRGASF